MACECLYRTTILTSQIAYYKKSKTRIPTLFGRIFLTLVLEKKNYLQFYHKKK